MKLLLASRLAADHADRWRGLWAFRRALICHLPIRIAAAIEGLWRLFIVRRRGGRRSKTAKKKGLLQAWLATPRPRLEPG